VPRVIHYHHNKTPGKPQFAGHVELCKAAGVICHTDMKSGKRGDSLPSVHSGIAGVAQRFPAQLE
jgi:hypothetical protein